MITYTNIADRVDTILDALEAANITPDETTFRALAQVAHSLRQDQNFLHYYPLDTTSFSAVVEKEEEVARMKAAQEQEAWQQHHERQVEQVVGEALPSLGVLPTTPGITADGRPIPSFLAEFVERARAMGVNVQVF